MQYALPALNCPPAVKDVRGGRGYRGDLHAQLVVGDVHAGVVGGGDGAHAGLNVLKAEPARAARVVAGLDQNLERAGIIHTCA